MLTTLTLGFCVGLSLSISNLTLTLFMIFAHMFQVRHIVVHWNDPMLQVLARMILKIAVIANALRT
jgi:hypothetical protein